MLNCIGKIKSSAELIISAVELYKNEYKKEIGTEKHRQKILSARILKEIQEINTITYKILLEQLKEEIHNFQPTDEDIEKMKKEIQSFKI